MHLKCSTLGADCTFVVQKKEMPVDDISMSAPVQETRAARIPPVFPLLGAASFFAFSTRYALAPLVSVFIAAQAGFTAAQKTYTCSTQSLWFVALIPPQK